MVKAFRVTGKFRMGSRFVDFTKEVASENKNSAIEKIYSDIGSRHKTKRKKIEIETITELDPEEIENVYVREKMEAENA